MASLLLIDSDSKICRELTVFLQRWKHRVAVQSNEAAAAAELIRNGRDYDIVLIDMSRNRPQDWAILNRIQKLHLGNSWTHKTLCFSTAYWGPAMQLAIERLGARLVYVQPISSSR